MEDRQSQMSPEPHSALYKPPAFTDTDHLTLPSLNTDTNSTTLIVVKRKKAFSSLRRFTMSTSQTGDQASWSPSDVVRYLIMDDFYETQSQARKRGPVIPVATKWRSFLVGCHS